MITLRTTADINWENVEAIAFYDAPVQIAPELLDSVDEGRARFHHLIEQGVPCYGVTTGLGQLVTQELSKAERDELPHNILRARAAAIGPPLPQQIVRVLLVMRLVNFLSGLDGVRAELCQFLVDRLNDGFTPWVPSLGHGMAADVTAHTHAFQTFIGEGFALEDGARIPAAGALANRGVAPLQLEQKEGLAFLNGIAATPAYAMDAQRVLSDLLRLATAVAAVSCEGVAAPKDAFDLRLKAFSAEPGVGQILNALQPLLINSQIQPHKLQSAISFRIIPQVHGALADALAGLRQRIEGTMQTFSDNPLMVEDENDAGGRFLSVGLFHNQHLVNQVDHVALALAHVGSLSVRRLHRLLSAENTGLSVQLAARPGLDSGLVVAHKAALGIEARLKPLANPLSNNTGESSAGQEDYMSMAFPAIARLYEMAELTKMILAYELLGGLTAVALRTQKVGEQPGDGVAVICAFFHNKIAPLTQDRSPGPDVEQILQAFETDEFKKIHQC